MTDVEQLLADRASAMAAHDGVPPGPVHFHGAANQLQGELIQARDRLMRPPVPAAPEAPAEEADAEAVAEDVALAGGEATVEAAAEDPSAAVADAEVEPAAVETEAAEAAAEPEAAA